MDFFGAEQRARRHTAFLVVLFSVAVCATVVAVYAAVRLAVLYAAPLSVAQVPARFWDPALFRKVAAGTLALIGAASIYKTRVVNAGADSLALGLGGRLVDPNTREPYERRLLNVVEEMAIASGVPVPAVLVLPAEPGINAFAIGLDPSRAAVAVTDGCLKLLSRDELQGVVAHEFSHLLNGDSRINLRLLGLVHGILVIGLIGSILMRSASDSGSSRYRRRTSASGAIFLVGLALYLVGSIGVFFTRLIKAAVSRERELLADASGVQFTRNPQGLAGALKKIGGLDQGSRMLAPRAEEASHFYFAQGIPHLFALMSTHPPLLERIRLLDPEFQGALDGGDLAPVAPEEEAAGVSALAPGAGSVHVQPRTLVSTIGALGDQHIAWARSLVERIPQRLRDAIREPWVARAVVLGLLLDEKPQTRTAQLEALLALGTPQLADQVARAATALRALPAETRLPMVDLALPALRRLSAAQYVEFRESVDRLIRADARIGLFEYTLQRVLMRHLAIHFEPERPERAGPPIEAADAVSILLSMLAHAGSADPAEAARAFAAACAEVSKSRFRPTLLPREKCDIRALDAALVRLGETAPRLRADVLAACVAAVASDGKVTIAEGELLRAISDSLGCPMPPLLPGQHVGAAADEEPAALQKAGS